MWKVGGIKIEGVSLSKALNSWASGRLCLKKRFYCQHQHSQLSFCHHKNYDADDDEDEDDEDEDDEDDDDDDEEEEDEDEGTPKKKRKYYNELHKAHLLIRAPGLHCLQRLLQLLPN